MLEEESEEGMVDSVVIDESYKSNWDDITGDYELIKQEKAVAK